MPLKNDLLLRAARGENTERTPVWMMRQAGRVLPQYRAVRSTAGDFKTMVKNPEFATEVTIQPVDHFDVDAAIIFSDILVIPEAMGLNYEMVEAKGPFFPQTINNAADVDKLKLATPEDLKYVTDAIALTKKELNDRVPLIGFAGAPWTIFCYMVEGKGSKTFSKAKAMLYSDPVLAHRLLDLITESTISYLKAQIKSGADIVQVFDSWAGVLSPETYRNFALKYINRICDAIMEVPVIVFAKGAFFARRDLRDTSCRVVGLDWNMDPVESRELVGPDKTLQGNLDPCVLYAGKETIREETKKMVNAFAKGPYIANLGHGLYPDINPDHALWFVEAVREFSSKN